MAIQNKPQHFLLIYTCLSGPKAQIDRAASRSQSYFVWKKSPSFFRGQSMLTTPFSMSSASPLSSGSAIQRIITKSLVWVQNDLEQREKLYDFHTMVILFLLLGVSAKHFIDEDSTTVSQNETTGSATYSLWIAYKTKKVHQQRYISFTLEVQHNISYKSKRDISTELGVHWKAITELWQ